ncbi:mitotic spindle checkpoint protein MAD2 [Tanacetum coccineum]
MLLACSSCLDLVNAFVNGSAGLSSDLKATALSLSQNISMESCTVWTTPRSPMKFFIQIASFEASQAAIFSDSHVEYAATVSCFELFYVTVPPFKWLEAGKLQRIVLVIMNKATNEVLERWNFSIETDKEVVEKGISREKSDKEIMREIQAIMRQIASSITYLPCLDEPCIFDVLAYADKDVDVPFTWTESDPKLIENPQMVKLHSFDTKIHKVDTLVSYKNDEWDEQ